MTPGRMLELANFIRSRLDVENQVGVVVTHGTDTLEECAYLADLVLNSPKPVIFVGAMRNSSEAGWDGPVNLRSALRVALAGDARELGVLIVMNDHVLSARDATKTHTEAANAFQGRDFGPLGLVDKDQVLILRRPVRKSNEGLAVAALDERVEIVKLSAGSDGRVLDFLVQSGCRGVVLEGLGRGNVPLAAVETIRRVAGAGLPLVLTSRCPRGRVLDTYAYEGGGRRLREMGLILGGFLPSHKARLHLMLLLGAGRSVPEIRAAFEGC
jgi:L-asparaginase